MHCNLLFNMVLTVASLREIFLSFSARQTPGLLAPGFWLHDAAQNRRAEKSNRLSRRSARRVPPASLHEALQAWFSPYRLHTPQYSITPIVGAGNTRRSLEEN
jgi:hypothetical protein